jgi:hypothetical protein
MAKHKKYSRKRRGQKRNRQASRKMRGGLNTPSFDETPESLHLSELNNTISSNGSNNSQLPSFDNIEPIAPEEQFHLDDDDLNLDLSNDSSNISNVSSNISNVSSLDNFGDSLNEGDTTFQSQDTDTFQSDSGSVDTIESNNTTGSDVSLGGKLRKNKKKTNKRKSKKSKKTHKNKKRRQRGGIIL